MTRLIIGLFVFIPFYCPASVDIAFVELRTPAGRIVQLEKDGRFAHVAISFQGNWLHAYPRHGVEIISRADLEKIGAVRAIVTVPELAPLSPDQVDKYLGKPYDPQFSWQDDKIYCSELVAKLLGIAPRPMVFDPELWPKNYQYLDGQPGQSPDEIFRLLQVQGYKAQIFKGQCSKVFR